MLSPESEAEFILRLEEMGEEGVKDKIARGVVFNAEKQAIAERWLEKHRELKERAASTHLVLPRDESEQQVQTQIEEGDQKVQTETTPSFKIDIVPSIVENLKHGEEVPYGWSVRVHRWLSDRSGAGLFRKVKPLPKDAGEPTKGHIIAHVEEFAGPTTTGRKLRDMFVNKRFDFRSVRDITGWACRWYESASVEVVPPFQKTLTRDRDITYRLHAEVFASDGQRIGEACLTFANLPTYCSWDVELDRPGGIEKVVDGRRIVAGTRAAVYPGDFTGEGRAGFVHVVGTLHIAAYDATGRKLWAHTDGGGVPVYNSVSARAFDINADGKDEVITMWGKPPEARIQVLEGTTGKVLREAAWPRNQDDLNRWHHGGNRGDMGYTYDAKIYIANFRGLDQPRDLILQTGDENLAVYSILTDELELLWEFDVRAQRQKDDGAGTHSVIVYDVDGDGHDEMLVGTYMLNHDGEIRWMLPFAPTFSGGGDNHIDLADVGPVGKDGRVVVAFPNNCVVADAGTGDILWKHTSGHGQWAYIRKVRPNLPGNQIIFAEKLETRRLFDADGVELDWPDNGAERDWWADGEGMPLWPSAWSEVGDWDGDGHAEETVGTLVIDRYGRAIGIGVWLPCPLVKEDVVGSTLLTLRLNFNTARAQAFSGIPIPPPGNKKLNFPRYVYNVVD